MERWSRPPGGSARPCGRGWPSAAGSCLAPGELLRWKRENSMLYTMYLEQRHNQILFARRDRDRRQGKEASLWSGRS